jgi:hypothetical protein
MGLTQEEWKKEWRKQNAARAPGRERSDDGSYRTTM